MERKRPIAAFARADRDTQRRRNYPVVIATGRGDSFVSVAEARSLVTQLLAAQAELKLPQPCYVVQLGSGADGDEFSWAGVFLDRPSAEALAATYQGGGVEVIEYPLGKEFPR